MGVVCITGCLVHFFTTKERVKPLAEEEAKLTAKTVFGMLFKCRSWVLNMCYIICYGVINLLLMSCITYYATYILGSTAAATAIQAAYLVASIGSSFLVSVVDRAIGRKMTMLAAAALFIVGKIWFVANPFSIGAIYVNAITVGIAVTITFVMFNTNRNNIVDIIEWQSGRRLDSLVSTADNLAAKLAVAGATWLVTAALAAAGFDANLAVQPESAINTINAVLGWVPMLVAVVMIVVIFFLNIDQETKKMLEEKAAQAQG